MAEEVNATFFLLSQSSMDDSLVSVSSKKLVPGFIMVRNHPSDVRFRTILDLTGACGMAVDAVAWDCNGLVAEIFLHPSKPS